MDKITLVVKSGAPRADAYICACLNGFTRSAVKKLMDGGAVLCGGARIKPAQSLSEGDVLEITPPKKEERSARPEDIPIEIVYEDGDLAVVNKPQGMTVHMGNGNKEGTLVNALLYRLDSLSGINGVIRPGIVHRIDKNTSGLMVVAKNDAAHLSLSRQIADKSCRRSYVALLEGVLGTDSGTVTTYIGRSPQDRKKMAVVEPDKGRLAITDYTVLERYREGYTLCRFDLRTGRTHQIRVHAKYLSHPVVGDPEYGIKRQKFALAGQLLHSRTLAFTHPRTGEVMSFEAPLPDYFQRVLKNLTVK